MPRTPGKPLVNLVMTEEEIEEIDTWRFANRFAARAEAMRWLMKFAMREAPTITREEREALSA